MSAAARVFDDAVAHDRAGRPEAAERLLTELLDRDPLHEDALHRLCGNLARTRRHDEALARIRRAAELRPDKSVYHRIAAEILRQIGRHDEAFGEAGAALACDPQDHIALHIRSSIHLDRRACDEAAADAQRVLALRPDFAEAHLRLGEIHLLRGAFAAGWAAYDWNSRTAIANRLLPPDRETGPRWEGENLPDGTLLLVADQGFGDAIQFARYIGWARPFCRDVALACDARLRDLLAQALPGVTVFDRWDSAPAAAAWSSLSRLPLLHGTTVATIPPPLAITADATLWRAKLDGVCPTGARRFGLVWAGRPSHPNDINRSTSLAELAPLTDRDGIFVVSLQPAQSGIAAYRGRAPLLDAGRLVHGFADTAAVIAALDLVITVDTAVAHLAGSMGKPVWLMLPYMPDWRWLLDRDDSPWYPTARLFRQPAHGRWDLVAAALAAAL